MNEYVTGLFQRYRSRGVLVDTNILLLFFVGSFERTLITRFKRTNQYRAEDYDLLCHFLSHFDRMATTPHVLSEVNSLSHRLVNRPEPSTLGTLQRKSASLRKTMWRAQKRRRSNSFKGSVLPMRASFTW